MDKIDKYILKLSSPDALVAKDIIRKLIVNDTKDLSIKKLRGYEDIYRVRFGKHRLIFWKKDSVVKLISLNKRDDQTYGKL